jgi:uncharacterized protein YyaL (SSP411 family)
MWRDGRLLATYKDGRAHLNAYLDDYAYLVDAILELSQLRFRADELDFARELSTCCSSISRIADAGGFFFTSDDHEVLMHRSKILSDDATPSPATASPLCTLAHGLPLGETRYLDAAERTCVRAGQALAKYPDGHTSLLLALEERLHPTEIVILSGRCRRHNCGVAAQARRSSTRRGAWCLPSQPTSPICRRRLRTKSARGPAIAYVCRGMTCSAPIDSLDALLEDLGD